MMRQAAKESFVDAHNNSSSSVPKIVGGIIAVLVCCACVVILGAAGILYYETQPSNTRPLFPPPVFENVETSTPAVELIRPPIESVPPDTIQTLLTTIVPENDPYKLACRLEGLCNVPETIQGKTYQVGEKQQFWVVNSDTAEDRQITATLLYITEHSYFWAEDGTQANVQAVKALMDTFEQKIYPTDREFFGSEWTPGVDGDPHIFVIYAKELGTSVAGYFYTSDAYNPLIKEHSNGHETFMIHSTQNLGNSFTYSTLAHEFVHMIQFASDRNEDLWLSEGFADLGAFLNGYDIGGHDWAYVSAPDLQLNDWTSEVGSNSLHYGQSFLYLAYFLDRFGEDATKALTSNSENGLTSLDHTLAELNITDPQTGQTVTADDVFMDWAAALYLQDADIGDGRYTYHNYPQVPQYTPTEFISDCPRTINGSVNQYGVDYTVIHCAGDYTLHFSGSTVSKLLPPETHSGEYAFWSNKGDYSAMTLTREFDFTNASGSILMSYQTWYNIEEEWDYLYLETSTDGQNWQILQTPSGTDRNPTGNAYGWGYTGAASGWILEEVDLSQFAGQKVQIRFEYVTDAAVNEEGLLLDDVRVEAINYASDFETDDGGWVADGFVRVQNVLPQTYRVSLVLKGDTTTVTSIELNPDNTADIPLSLKTGDEAVLIVTGIARFTNIPAAYQMEIK
jgi:immune inhibitor A